MSDTNINSKGLCRPLRIQLVTFGCQMNAYDSEVAEGLLAKVGFEAARDEESADVVIMNTCSVREHAEGRVYGRLGMLGHAKKENPDLIVGLMGCMVEEHKEKLFQRFPQLDLMVGTRNIKELPGLIDEVRRNRRQVAKIKQDGLSIEYTDQIKRKGRFHAWLPIMTGCNKVCTFCIVPITRGAEVSMPAREVYREASRLVEEGVKRITLLGQNVNSYNGKHFVIASGTKLATEPSASPSGPFGGQSQNGIAASASGLLAMTNENISFPQLLDMLCQIKGLERICFTTSHPHDATEELFQVIARNPKISRRFHLPLQSGSNRMLKRMKRLHTYEEFKAKIDRMRQLIPDVSVTTDIIAGFCGEEEDDHRATLRALGELRFDGAYIYKYSLRPGTPAAKLEDDVPLAVKEARNAELLQHQKRIAEENDQAWIGKTANVFVENPSRKDHSKLIGLSNQERRIVFEGNLSWIGSFRPVRIVDVKSETFLGEAL